METDVECSGAATLLRLRAADACALLWIVGVGVGLLLPSLIHGPFLGSFDMQSGSGLAAHAGVVVHNRNASDQIAAIIPWTTVTWQQVHAGILPLWNPYNGTGLPLASNWQSAPLAVPTVVGYLVPLRYAYDAAILTTLIVAGSGVYVLARVLRLGTIPAVFAATAFELSGPLTGWLGFPHAGVMSWGGWLLAAASVIIGGRRRTMGIAFFAIAVACTLVAGQPEVAVVMLGATAVYCAVVLAYRLPWTSGRGPLGAPILDLAIGAVAGAFLSAPFVLPGLQVVSKSARSAPALTTAMTPHDLMYVIAQGFDGLPLAHQVAFSFDTVFYAESAAYVGLVAVVLAVIAVITRIRRPEVVALLAVAVACLLVLFTPWVRHAIFHIPLLNTIGLTRALMPLALAVALAAGIGLDHLLRRADRGRAATLLGSGFGVAGIVLVVVYVASVPHLPQALANERRGSFVWPAIGVMAGLAAAGILALTARPGAEPRAVDRRRSRIAGGLLLLGAETGFLLAAGTPILSSSTQFFVPTSGERSLQQAVGASRIGYSAGPCAQIGIRPDINAAYGIHQLDAYDPIIPASYYRSWTAITGTSPGSLLFNLYCPRVTSATIARLYGVRYLLQPTGGAAPDGTVLVGDVGNEQVFRVPGSGLATTTPSERGAPLPAITAPGTPVDVRQPDPATWHMRTSTAVDSVLRLRLTDLPGWTATIDGRSLALSTFAGSMLQARIPAGTHSITLRYWPRTLTLGIVLAIVSAASLAIALVVDLRRRCNAGRTRSE